MPGTDEDTLASFNRIKLEYLVLHHRSQQNINKRIKVHQAKKLGHHLR